MFKHLYWKDILIVARKKMVPEIKIDKFAKRNGIGRVGLLALYWIISAEKVKIILQVEDVKSLCESVELPNKRLLYVG